MGDNDVQELRESVAALRREVEQLRQELAQVRPEPARPKPLPVSPPQPPAPKAPAPKAPALAAAPAPAKSVSTEQFVGERLLHYVGVTLLALGAAFFLVWRAAHTTPLERVLTAAGAGAALLAASAWTRKRPPYDKISNALAGGGWAILYLTVYGARAFEATRVLTDPGLELQLLAAVACGAIGHALVLGSRAFRVFCFGLSYFVLLICGRDVAGPQTYLVLHAACSALAVWSGYSDILLVSALGFCADYLPLYIRALSVGPTELGGPVFREAFATLSCAYLTQALVPLIPRARAKFLTPAEEPLWDASLCFNALSFMVLACALGSYHFPVASFSRSAALSLYLALPALAYAILLPRRMSAGYAAPILGLLLLAAAILRLPSPMGKMLAWIAVSSLWVWIGLFLEHPAWRVSGLVMAMATYGFYFHIARHSADERRSAAMALFVFSALSYLASRYYRVWLKGEVPEWEKDAREYWLYAGTAALLLALRGVLEPPAFALSLIAVAVIAAHAAALFSRLHLWAQASALSVAAGAYALMVDYGPNLPVAGPLTPRLVVCAGLVAGMAYLLFADVVPRELSGRWTLWSADQHRAALAWSMTAVYAFAVYQEFPPRVRLPIWALSATAAYLLGRSQKQDALKAQAAVFALAAGAEGLASYAAAPGALLGGPSLPERGLYWGSALVLLGNVLLARSGTPGPADRRISWTFSGLALAMMAVYLAREFEAYQITLAWSLTGFAYLIGGMLLDAAELRLPALGLLGLCVLKAVVLDTSKLPLPQRVASLVVLGLVLVLASAMYVRAGGHDKKDPSSGAA
ncbi:MAG TPA: DUF2339 domain-containing protein [Elusimicrobiota bacterium]|nr:DUF2339 domain-containing protein [Elusimicrobiota bacterium]